MGGNASKEACKSHAVDRAGLEEAEYTALRCALRVEQDHAGARVELADFVSVFPPHVRSFVQPLFSRLACERVGETSASWPALVKGVARVVHGGTSWELLLGAWVTSDPSSSSSASAAEQELQELLSSEVELYLELAISLCFWSAFPCPPAASPLPSPVAGPCGGGGEGEGEGGGVGAGGREAGGSQGQEVRADDFARAPEDFSRSSAAASTMEELRQLLRSLGRSIAPPAGTALSLNALAVGLEALLPQLPAALGPLFSAALLGGPPPPALALRAESHILRDSWAFLLRGSDARLWATEAWEPLYRDWSDGRSFNALLKGVLQYQGPALLLLRTATGEVLGAMSTCWEDLNGRFQTLPESFLFSLTPRLRVLRSASRTGNHLYLNGRNKHAPRGLGFGGQLNFFRLWLDADFEECYTLESDATFGGEPLAAETGFQVRFEVSVVEVWGCGGVEALRAQTEQRQRAEGVRESARKVDRAKLLENEFDREMFLQHTFKASDSERASDT